MSNIELAKVKQRIIALTSKTTENGCTEQEMISAMDKVGELLRIYNLTLADCQIADERCIQEQIDLGRSTRPRWVYVFAAIGKFTGVKVWTSKPHVCFFGFEPDVQMALYLSNLVLLAMKTEGDRFKQTPTYKRSLRRRHLMTSFTAGLTQRLDQRLRQTAPVANTSRGRDLVLAKEMMIEDMFRQNNPDLSLRKIKTRKISVHGEAFQAGKAAGDRVNLSRPVGSTNNQPIGLLT